MPLTQLVETAYENCMRMLCANPDDYGKEVLKEMRNHLEFNTNRTRMAVSLTQEKTPLQQIIKELRVEGLQFFFCETWYPERLLAWARSMSQRCDALGYWALASHLVKLGFCKNHDEFRECMKAINQILSYELCEQPVSLPPKPEPTTKRVACQTTAVCPSKGGYSSYGREPDEEY